MSLNPNAGRQNTPLKSAVIEQELLDAIQRSGYASWRDIFRWGLALGREQAKTLNTELDINKCIGRHDDGVDGLLARLRGVVVPEAKHQPKEYRVSHGPYGLYRGRV